MKYFLHDAPGIHVVNANGQTGWSCFRQKGSDKNHTGLSPCGITVICGFVLTSDQVHHQGTMIIGSRIGAYFSHGFGDIHVYLGLSDQVVVPQALREVHYASAT